MNYHFDSQKLEDLRTEEKWMGVTLSKYKALNLPTSRVSSSREAVRMAIDLVECGCEDMKVFPGGASKGTYRGNRSN